MSLPTSTREYYFPEVGSIDNLVVRDAAIPPLKAGDVLVSIKAVSLNYRDLLIATNNYGFDMSPNLVPVSDGAGQIIAVGEDVKGWKVGERVSANFSLDHIHGDTNPDILKTALGAGVQGVLTQYKSFPAYSLVRIPDRLSYEEASTLPCAAVTAYNALHGPKPIKAGDTVLVQGTGGVSIFALQFAVASGATVIATSSSDEKLKLAQKLGAKHLINYKTTPNWDDEVIGITNGRGVDHIIEVSAALEKSLNALRVEGSIHVIGSTFAANEKPPLDISLSIIRKGANIRGILIGSVALFQKMNRLIEAHEIHPVVDKVFPFGKTVEAYEYLRSQQHAGKVVIRVSED